MVDAAGGRSPGTADGWARAGFRAGPGWGGGAHQCPATAADGPAAAAGAASGDLTSGATKALPFTGVPVGLLLLYGFGAML
ncbi:MAG: hypothetical protein QOC83_5787, partial [Pseudonocardiales bacterium]|nr:hypothetical protein [Pseudonocardiales bacterium]